MTDATPGSEDEFTDEPDVPPTDNMAEGLVEDDPREGEDEWTPLPIEEVNDDPDHQ